MKKSNKYLSKVLKRLSRLDFSKYRRGYFNQIGVLNRIPFEIFDLEPTSSNYVYRAVINKPNTHYETSNSGRQRQGGIKKNYKKEVRQG